MSDHSILDDTVHSTETTFEKPKVEGYIYHGKDKYSRGRRGKAEQGEI